MTDLQEWLVGEVADAIGRLDGQVLSCVPPERRLEHPGGGSSITWVTFHIARHAALAAAVIDGAPILQEGGGFSSVIEGGAGLEEAEQAWVATLDDAAVGHFAHDVLARVRERLSRLSADVLESVPDTEAILEASDISRDRYGWLYDMWVDKPTSFFVRWPLVGHVTNHVGEMIATRNRMGLSPF